MIKKILAFFMVAAFAIIMITSCSTEIYQSTFQTTSFTEKIDSSNMETLRFYDNKTRLQYSVTNDNQNLYICIKATEEFTQFKLIRAGMQLSIGNIGKKLLPANIIYPLAMGIQDKQGTPDQRKQQGIPQGKDINALKMQFKSKYQELHLSGFKPQIGMILPLKNDYGLNVNLDWDLNNTMYYKASIPFKTFYKDNLDLSDTSKVLDICITINGIEMQHKSENNNMEGASSSPGMNQGRMGGGSRMGGQGMGGGRMGKSHQGGQSNDELTEPNKIKFKLQLVVGKK